MLRLYVLFAAWTGRRDLPGACVYRRLTGRRCPLCGLTHAVAHAVRGDLRRSTVEHRLAVPLILLTAGEIVVAVGRAARRLPPSGHRP
nr:DUF2752 domain-containing protein [Pseudonocardia acidicola]